MQNNNLVLRLVRFSSSIMSDVIGFVLFAAILAVIFSVILLSVNLTIWTCTAILAFAGLAGQQVLLTNLFGVFLLLIVLLSAKSLWIWLKWHWQMANDNKNNVDKTAGKE